MSVPSNQSDAQIYGREGELQEPLAQTSIDPHNAGTLPSRLLVGPGFLGWQRYSRTGIPPCRRGSEILNRPHVIAALGLGNGEESPIGRRNGS